MSITTERIIVQRRDCVQETRDCFNSIAVPSSRIQIDGRLWVLYLLQGSMFKVAFPRYVLNVAFRAALGTGVACLAGIPLAAGCILFVITSAVALVFKMLALVIAKKREWNSDRTAFCLQVIQAISDVALLIVISLAGFSNPVVIGLVAAIAAYSIFRAVHTGCHSWDMIRENTKDPLIGSA